MDLNNQQGLELQLDGFHGPLDLLLHLVRKQKVSISEINITEITEQYADFLKQMEQMSLDIAGDYFVMASTLMLMKAKALIPRERDSFLEMKEELIFQLEEYEKIVKQVSYLDKLRKEAEKRAVKGYVEKFSNDSSEIILKNTSAFILVEHYAKVIERIKAATPIVIKPKPYTMKEVADYLYSVFADREKERFSRLVQGKDKGFLIYTFVSVLEMVKHGMLTAVQTDNFSEIVLIRKKNFDISEKEQVLARFES
jgi:segregation and condensation protein A